MRGLDKHIEKTSAASFRDPAGYVFRENGVYKRAVTSHGAADYGQLMSSGLYQKLVDESLLVAHREESSQSPEAVLVLVPEQIPYVSYPYEWSFGQLRDAALLTLRIQDMAMHCGMSLKDASAFNVQFRGAQAVFIDTLSFERNDGGPWVAYNQFCRHFLAPLLLMSRVSPSFNQFWKASLDGFPLDLTSALLPKTTYLSFGTLMHIHLHAKMQRKYAGKAAVIPQKALVKSSGPDRKVHIVASLRNTIESVKPGRFQTEWRHYYESASHYSDAAADSKRHAVERTLDLVRPERMFDLGGNTGAYSRLAADRGIYTVCFDVDPLCVHDNYERARLEKNKFLLPLFADLTNPSPSLGFALRERGGLFERGEADMVLALALLHHLRITGNAPLLRIAEFLSKLGKFLLIEYVPKSDAMAQTL
ncbi:MAG: SAM-dependent methyltransferase, partial [Acidobacteria bacterium]|nr:SAM-dependent methyltransferase [Acidobacteriota bacterium]